MTVVKSTNEMRSLLELLLTLKNCPPSALEVRSGFSVYNYNVRETPYVQPLTPHLNTKVRIIVLGPVMRVWTV